MIIYIAISLLFVIVASEILRPKIQIIDTLSLISCIYAICFAVIPIAVQYVDFEYNASSGWSWINSVDFSSANAVWAQILTLIGYFCILVGYFIVDSKQHAEYGIMNQSANYSYVIKVGAWFGLISLVSLIIYANSLGGFVNMITYSGALRTNDAPIHSNYAFLKNILPFSIPASLVMLLAIKSSNSPQMRFFVKSGFVLMLSISIIVLFHQAGRLNLVAYLSVFVLGNTNKNRRINWLYYGVCAFMFTAFILFGKEIFHYFQNPGFLSNKAEGASSTSNVANLLAEFVFPYANIVRILETGINVSSYRVLTDFLIAPLYILPDSLLPTELQETVSMINTQNFGSKGTIPVDILSFGYYSLGILGVIVSTVIYGVVAKLLENLITFHLKLDGYITATYTTFIAFRIMYFDPTMSLINGFYLIVFLALIIIPKFLMISTRIQRGSI